MARFHFGLLLTSFSPSGARELTIRSRGPAPVKKDPRRSQPLAEWLALFEFPAMNRCKLNELVAEVICKELVHGTLRPGDRLPSERELAKRLAVSRATVREAIQLLAERGLVEQMRRQGTYSRSIHPRSVGIAIQNSFVSHNCSELAVHEFRKVFEPKVAALAASNARLEDINRLENTLLALEETWITNDSEGLAFTDTEFHLALATASQNAFIRAVALGLKVLLERSLTVNRTCVHSAKTLMTHRAVFWAVAHRQPVRAEHALEKQFETS
jgi:GntR family transcriptional repressor for pyruvate dehydrogenase complex